MNQNNYTEDSDEEEQEEDARTLKLGRAFADANALTYSEINILLKHYISNKRAADSNFQLNPMLKLAQEYAERFASTSNSDVAQQIRNVMVDQGLGEFELAAIANLGLDSAEEVRDLVPSVFAGDGDQLSEEQIQDMLNELATYKRA